MTRSQRAVEILDHVLDRRNDEDMKSTEKRASGESEPILQSEDFDELTQHT